MTPLIFFLASVTIGACSLVVFETVHACKCMSIEFCYDTSIVLK
jgi:hypothetical protein